ncbi:hypothetical protein [Streptomyces beihaiensis]|uniref:Uncharacterized protein n=1 Tax=Streptomyces beihaiensis TaxID=2984495 RepID=A0ABT3TYV4_9ACTN|nr:hypothetical protein [Streptomyces beihaiensis]MCX3062226.1 hypothetical protein [Streptomyces beihaiensis]
MSSNIRRAAGTQTFFDVLLRWLWIKRPSPTRDRDDFLAGTTLTVSCFSRAIAGGSACRQLGYLHLTHGQPITWHRSGRRPVVLRPPFALIPCPAKSPGRWKLASFHLDTAEGPRDLLIPKLDGPLVEQALKAADT